MTVHTESSMKILVLFNFEFCYDLWRKDCKDVTFASDDELKNRIVENTWKFKSELVEPRSINKKFEGMKFDLIISNPPYNKGLDLKILESVLDLSENICFVHPSRFLFDKTEKYIQIKKKLDKRIVSTEMINANRVFSIALFMPCSITFISKKREKIKVSGVQSDFQSSDQFYDNIEDINKFGNDPRYYSIIKKISCVDKSWSHITKSEKTKTGVFCSFSIIRGHVGSNDFYTILPIQDRIFEENRYGTGFEFDSIENAKRFQDYLKSKFSRFCNAIGKTDQHVGYGLIQIPWFNFSRSWSDEEVATELGITNEELLWMIQQIPDYYPEDAEIYRKLEKKLMNK